MARIGVEETQGNVIYISRYPEKKARNLRRADHETPVEFEKRAARVAELEMELGIF